MSDRVTEARDRREWVQYQLPTGWLIVRKGPRAEVMLAGKVIARFWSSAALVEFVKAVRRPATGTKLDLVV